MTTEELVDQSILKKRHHAEEVQELQDRIKELEDQLARSREECDRWCSRIKLLENRSKEIGRIIAGSIDYRLKDST